MKLTVLVILVAPLGFSQTQSDIAANGKAGIVHVPSVPTVIDKDLAAVFESYALKFELASRRADDENVKAMEQFKLELEKRKTKATDDARALLAPKQEEVRLRICKAASLPDTCEVYQDAKTGDWMAKPKDIPKKP